MKTLITKWYLFVPILPLFCLSIIFWKLGFTSAVTTYIGTFYLITLFRRIWFPWSFPLIAMLVELKSVETDTSKWDLNHLSAFSGISGLQ